MHTGCTCSGRVILTSPCGPLALKSNGRITLLARQSNFPCGCSCLSHLPLFTTLGLCPVHMCCMHFPLETMYAPTLSSYSYIMLSVHPMSLADTARLFGKSVRESVTWYAHKIHPSLECASQPSPSLRTLSLLLTCGLCGRGSPKRSVLLAIGVPLLIPKVCEPSGHSYDPDVTRRVPVLSSWIQHSSPAVPLSTELGYCHFTMVGSRAPRSFAHIYT
jgi:hypothetical protein